MAAPTDAGHGIAIIGAAGRFPGASNLSEYWQNLCAGVESIRRLSPSEAERAGVTAARRRDANYVPAAAMIDNVDGFDAGFFGFSAREAEITDPQHRILLECAWAALDDAGYCPDSYPGRVGVFAGAGVNSHLLDVCRGGALSLETPAGYQAYIGNDKDFLATRISYKLNLRGPSLTLQTACSTSLVAVHYACESLYGGECDLALAGAVSVSTGPASGYLYQEGAILSPDGHCRAFDAGAKGTVLGSGAGVVVLKRLADALADQDSILAVILGSAVNNDGAGKVGYTAPSVEGQASAIAEAHAISGVDPQTITYVETHGTGTRLGDPIEVHALTKAFRQGGATGRQYCAIGSVKTNIGHADVAAGMAGLIKAVLALRHAVIPPSLHFKSPNPQIDFASTPFFVNTALQPWCPPNGVRRAGVSSFGIGGTNVHVVLEQPPAVPSTPARVTPVLLPLSARDPGALGAMMQQMRDHLRDHPDINIGDVAFTMQTGRKRFSHRRALVCRDRDEAIAALDRAAAATTTYADTQNPEAKVVFMFPGQGSQHISMARELYEHWPVFRERFDFCATVLHAQLDLDLRQILCSPTPHDTADINQTRLAQPALFAVEYALACLLLDWGIRPIAMIGHSVGEYVAACLAGVFSVEDALTLVAARGRLMQSMPFGAMLSVPLPEARLRSLMDGAVDLACINGARLCTVAGAEDAIAAFADRLAKIGVQPARLRTSHAFHSRMMDPVVGAFTACVAATTMRPPQIPYLSNVTGTWITAEQATRPAYWADHLRGAVRFSDGLEVLKGHPEWILLEVGPGQTLTTLARLGLGTERQVVAASGLPAGATEGSSAALLEALATLWMHGVEMDWRAFAAGASCRRISLPSYPFNRQRYSVRSPIAEPAGSADLPPVCEIKWRAKPVLRFSKVTSAGSWLVFADARGVARSVVQRLRADGHAVTVVECEDTGIDGAFRLDPADKQAYASLIREVSERSAGRLRIIHCWGLDAAEPPALTAEELQRSYLNTSLSVIYMIQGVASLPPERIADTLLVTSGLHRVGNEVSVAVTQAPVWAFGKAIALEHPDLRCKLVDLDNKAADAGADLWTELWAAADDGEAEVVFRNGVRHVPRLVHNESMPGSEQLPIELIADGVYIITGGLGALGLQIAEWMVSTGARNLVLVGRDGLPDRIDWASVRHDPATRARIEKVRALEDAGARIRVVAADVGNRDQLGAAFTAAAEAGLPLRGVVHAAGVLVSCELKALTAELLAAAYRGKVEGAWLLHEATAMHALDFFVLMSSAASVWGAKGMSHYAAANQFLDALAQHRAAIGLPALVVNWGPWTIGMGGQRERETAKAAGVRPITPDASLAALGRLLQAKALQAIVADVDWDQFRAIAGARGRCALFDELGGKGCDASLVGVPRVPGSEASAESQSPEQRRAKLRDFVRAEVARLIGAASVDDVDVNAPLMQMGLDSLMAIELRNNLARTQSVSLPITLIFDHPTVEAIVAHLDPQSETSEVEPGLQPKTLQTAVAPLQVADEPIAIVGLGCRLPGGSDDAESLWSVLRDGADAIGEVPEARWDVGAYYDRRTDQPGKMYTVRGGFLDGVDRFDAQFFGIAPVEADSMDPQQRLLLEVAWEALENAGYAPASLLGTDAGVFIGIGTSDYARLQLRSGDSSWINVHTLTGNAPNIASGRLSYVLGLQGPSLSIDTACSSSLMAVHLACQALRARDCGLAIVGGVNLILAPEVTISLCLMHALSPDGRCKTFDAAADGFGRGEGCAVVILKRLSEAVEAGDNIVGVIRGSAANNDGRSTSLTAPNGLSQQIVIQKALASAGISARQIDYVETHGTGTLLGDPIELQSLGAIVAHQRRGRLRTAVGSIKTNIGHVEAAAGLASLIKVVLALQHQELPPYRRLREVNPHIPLEQLALLIAMDRRPWTRSCNQPRLAGVSSFGFSGTNVHLVVEEPPVAPMPPRLPRRIHILSVSARTESALRALAMRYADYIRRMPSVAVEDICHTANVGRSHWPHRVAVTGASRQEILDGLQNFQGSRRPNGWVAGHVSAPPKVAFLFTGQGAQYAGMGRQLYESEPVVRRVLQECEAAARPVLGRSLLEVMYGADEALINETEYAQPALFALECATAAMWRAWGVEPTAVVGHSIGEYAAACVAGVFSLEQGMRLVVERGRRMQALPRIGAMVALNANEARIREAMERIGGVVAIAAVNGPASTVISGERDAVRAVVEQLAQQGVQGQELRVSHAFHSPLMAPMAADFETVARGVEYRTPRLMMAANVTGEVLRNGQTLDASYWGRQITEPVRFADSVQALAAEGYGVWVEMGPQPTLSLLGEQAVGAGSWIGTLQRGREDWQQVTKGLAALYVQGVKVDWSAVERGHGRRVALPTYPFERQRHWVGRTESERPRREEQSKAATSEAAVQPETWLHKLVWRRQEPPSGKPNRTDRWLIVGEAKGLGKAIEEQARARGWSAAVTPPLSGVAAWVTMMEEEVDQVVVVPAMRDAIAEDEVSPADEAVQRCAVVLELVQALLARKGRRLPKLWVVTQGAQAVEDAVRNPAQAPVWGLGRVLRQEHPELWGGLVDLSPGVKPAAAARQVLEAITTGTEESAYRNERRYVPRLVRAEIAERHCGIRGDGTYLITGGLGGIGLKIAEWLVAQGARHLVLMGRSGAGKEATTTLSALERAGARARVCQGDVARAEQVSGVLREIDAQMPVLRGIIHAAGVVDDGVVREQSAARLMRVMQAKVAGAWNLHELTRGRDLDLFVLFSSTSAVLGAAGQSNYAAANAYLDALASWRYGQGLPGLSIAWGPWSGVGMAANLGALGQRLWQQRGIQAIAPAVGVEMFGASLAHGGSIVAAAADWRRWVGATDAGSELLSELLTDAKEPSESEQEAGELLRIVLAEPVARRRTVLLAYITRLVADILGLPAEPLDPRARLNDLGLDSMTAMELRRRLQIGLGQIHTLSATIAFDFPTPEALAAHIDEQTSHHDAPFPGSSAQATVWEESSSLSPEQTMENLYPEDTMENRSEEHVSDLLAAEIKELTRWLDDKDGQSRRPRTPES
jgi:epothilone polyketide synthase D